MPRKISFLFLFALTLGAGNLKADFISSNPQGSDTLNFPTSSMVNFTTVMLTSIQGNNLTLTAATPSAWVGNSTLNSGYGFGPNGKWYLPMVAVGTISNSIIFDFNGFTASSVGGFANYDPVGGVPLIEALDASNNVIESYNLAIQYPIDTPDATNAGAFVGISRSEGDIAGFKISGSSLSLQQLSFKVIPTPEPTAWNILIFVLALFPFFIWKKFPKVFTYTTS